MRSTYHVLTAHEDHDHDHDHDEVDAAAGATSSGASEFNTNAVKWGSSSAGTFSGTVTWSAASTNFAGQFVTFDSPVSGAFLTATRDAFSAWEAVANIKFSEVADASDVNIRLGFTAIDGPSSILGTAH